MICLLDREVRLLPQAFLALARMRFQIQKRHGARDFARFRRDAQRACGNEIGLQPAGILAGNGNLRDQFAVAIGKTGAAVQGDMLSGNPRIERGRGARERLKIAVDRVRGGDSSEPNLAAIRKPERYSIARVSSLRILENRSGFGTAGKRIKRARGIGKGRRQDAGDRGRCDRKFQANAAHFGNGSCPLHDPASKKRLQRG